MKFLTQKREEQNPDAANHRKLLQSGGHLGWELLHAHGRVGLGRGKNAFEFLNGQALVDGVLASFGDLGDSDGGQIGGALLELVDLLGDLF